MIRRWVYARTDCYQRQDIKWSLIALLVALLVGFGASLWFDMMTRDLYGWGVIYR